MRPRDAHRPSLSSRTALVAALTLSTISLAGALDGPAGASSKPKVVVATGAIVCTKVTGSVTYHPPVHHVGTTPETQVFSFHASHCTTTGSNVRHVTGGSLTASVHRTVNSCIDLLQAKLSSAKVTWTPRSIHPSTTHFSGFVFVTNAAGDEGFKLPNPGGTATVAGSFAGKDHGARSSATVYINTTALQFRDACMAPAGVAREAIIGGRVSFS